MQKRVEIAGLIIVIIIIILSALFFLTAGTTITQNIVFEDMQVTKTISLGTERTEIYEFELANPIIGYLVVPKTIATSASEITISGDFKTKVIREDPILKITSSELTPGTKKLVINSPLGDTNQTTILFPFPLAEYNTLSSTEKAQLEETINAFAQSMPETFTQEKSLEIMQQYANDIKTQVSGELQESEDGVKKKLLFAGINTTLTQAINSIQQFTSLPEIFQLPSTSIPPTNIFTQALSSIQSLTIQAPANFEDEPVTMTITFKPEPATEAQTVTGEKIPSEITLPYSAKTPIIAWKALIEKSEESPLPPNTELIIEGPENIRISYEKITTNDASKNIYQISLVIDTRNYYSFEDKETIYFKHAGILLSIPEKMEITFVNNPCTTRIITEYEKLPAQESEYENALYELLACTDAKAEEAIVELLKQRTLFEEGEIAEAEKILNVELDQANIASANPNFAQMTKKLDNAIASSYRSKAENYTNTNTKLKELTDKYTSILRTKLDVLYTLQEKTTKERTKDLADALIKKYELDIAEKEFVLDPTDWRAFEEIVRQKMFYLHEFNPNLTMASTEWENIENDIRKDYLEKYSMNSFSSWEYSPILLVNQKLVEIDKQIDAIEEQLVVLVSKCDEKDDYETKWKGICKNFVHQLATADISDESFSSIKARVDGIGQNFYTSYFDTVAREKGLMILGQDRDTQATIDILRNQIVRLVKQRTGLRLIGKQLLTPREEGRIEEVSYEPSTLALSYDERENQLPQGHYIPTYEISIPERLAFANGEKTLLEIYEQLYTNDVRDWFVNGTATTQGNTSKKASFAAMPIWDQPNDPEIKYARECVSEAFAGPLRSEIEAIKHFKFLPFILTMTQAASLQHEIDFVEYVYGVENNLAAIRMAKVKKQANLNYFFSYVVSSGFGVTPYNPANQNERSYLTMEGLELIKPQLLEGKSFLEIQHASTQVIEKKFGPQPKAITYSIQGDLGGEHGQINSTYTNEVETTAWNADVINHGGDEGLMWLAFTQPIMEIELEKARLIAENKQTKRDAITQAYEDNDVWTIRELVLPTEDAARFQMDVANFYYNNELYDEAIQQYISILVDYKTQVSTYPALAEILQTAEARTSSTVPTILFGSRAKEFWSKMGSTAREITSVESIAYIITVHGFMSKVMFQMQLESTLGQGVANAATPQVTSGLTSATSSDSVFTVVNGSNLTTLSNTSNAIAVAQTPSRLAKIFTSVKRVLTKPIGKVKPPSAAQLKRMKQLQDAYNKGYSQELCRRLKLKSIAELQIHGAESTMSTTSYTIWEHDYRTTLANLPDNEIQSLMRAYQQGTLSSTHPYYKMVHEANLYAKDVMTGKNTEFESLLRGANKPTSRLIAESRAEVSFYNNQILSLENELAALQASSTLSPNAIQVTTANLRQEISALRAGIESRSPVTITCNSCLFSPTPQPTVTTGTTTAPSEFEQLLQRQMATRTVSLPTNVINVSGGSTVFNSPLTKIIVEQAVTTGITAPLVTATPLASGVMKLLVVTATPVTVLPVTEMPEETNDDIVRIVVPTNVSVSTSTEPEQTLNNTPNSIPPGFSFTETPGELNSLNLLDAQGNRVAFVEFMPTSTLSQTKYYPFPKEGVVVEIMRADVEGLGYGQMVFEELIRRKRIVYTGYTELDGTNGGTSHSAGRMLKRVMDTGKFLFEVPGIPSKINNSGDMLRDTSIGDGLPLNEFYKVTVIPADKIGKVQNYVSRPGTPDEVVVVGPAIVSEDIAKLLTAGRRVYLEFVRLDRGEGDDIPEATDETLDALQLEIETRIATLVEMGLEQRFVEDVLSGSAEMPKTAKSTPDFANIENKIRAVREEGKQLGTGNTQGPVVELDGVPWTMQQQPYVGSAMIHILTNTNTGEKFIVKHNGVEHKSGRDREEFRFNPRTEYARAIEIPTELVEQGFYNPPIYTATDDSFNISRFIEGGEMEEGLAQYSSQTKAGASLAELAFACVSNHVVTPDVSFLGLHNIIRNNENGKPVLFDHGAQYYDPSRSTQELAEELLFDAFNRSKLSSKNVTIISEGEDPTLTSQGRDMFVRGYVFIRELAQRTGVQHMPTSQERSKKSVISPDGSETHFIAFTHSEYIPIPQTFEEYIDYLITNLPNQIYLRPTQVNNAELTQLLESQKGSFTYTPQTNTGATGTPKTVSLPVSGTDCVNGCVASVQASALVEDPTQANLAIQQGNVVEVNDLTRVESVTIAPNPRAGINAETEILGHTFPYGTNEAVIASPEFQAIKAQFIQNAAKGDSLEERQWLASLSDEDLVKLLIQPFNTVEAESFNHGNFSSYGVFRRYVLLGVLNKIHAEPLVRLAINLQAIDYASTSGEDEEVRMADAELINTTIAHSENIVNYVATNDLSPSLTVEATISRLVEDPNRLENWENFYDAFNRVQTNLTEEQALQVLDAFNRTNYFARAIPATEKDIQKALESAPKDDGTFGIFQDSRIYIAGVESKPEELYQISIIFEQLFNKLEALGTNQVRSLEKTNAILSKWLRTRVSLAQTSQAAPQIIRGNRSAINAESPAIAELLLDPAKSRALLEGLTTIRTVYTSASKQPDLSEEDQRIWINDNVFVRTDTSSFRRHVLVEVDAAGNVVGSVEIKIPGTYKHKLQVGEADYDVAQALAPAFGEDLQQGVAVIRYAGEAYSWYGQTMTFGEFVPMQIIVSEFDYDAFQKRQRLNEFFRKAELTKSEFENIKAQVLALMEKVFENGWTGNGDLVHLQNFTIEQLADGAYKIRLVNDLAEFKRQSEMSETEVDNSVATSRYKIESDLTVHEAKANRKAKLQSGTATFTCNSPCEWDSTGHRVKVVEGTNVEITGEFDEGHIAEVRTQRYTQNATDTKEATTGLDAEETEQAIDGFSQGKTVAILAGAASGKQEIKVYFKKELVDEEITGLAAQTEQSETTNTENSPAETIRGESFVINTAKENPETIMDLGRVGSLVTISDSLANLGRKMFVPKTGLNSLEKKAVMLMLAMRLMTAIGNPEINYGVKSFNEYYGTLNVHPIASVEQAEDIVAQATNDKGLTAIQKETTTVSCPVVASFASIKFADAGEGASCTFTNGSQVTSFVRDATKTEFAVNAKLTLPHRIEQQTTITYSQIDDLEELLQFTGLTPDNTKDYGFTLALLRIGRIVYIIVPSEIDGKEDLILLLPANENTGVNSLPKTIPLTDLVGKQSSVSTAFQVTRNLTDPFTGAKDWPKFSSINMSEIPVGTRFVVSGYFGDRTYDYHFKKISDTKMLICSGADLSQGFIFKIGQMYSMVGENLVTADVYPATFVEQSTVAYPYFNFVNGKLIPLSQLPQSKDKEIFGPVEKIRVEPQTNSFVTPKQNYSKTTVVASDGTEFKFGMQLKDSPARTDAYGATIGHKVFGELRLLKMTDFPNANATLLFRLEEGSDGTFTAVAGHYGSTTGGLADIIEESSTEFSVAKTLQTKYSGIGTTLLDMAVHKAKEFGATEFELIDAIRSAIPFYESYGFECVETNFVSGKHDCRLNLATKTIPQYTITRRSKIFQTINADAFKTGLTSNTFTYEFRDNLMRDFIYTNQVDAQYNQFLPDSFHADAPLTPVKVIGFFDGKQSHIRFLQIPKLSREDTWPNSQAEWEMHALAILIRDVKGASLTQAETDAINDALLGNADFPDFVLQNAFAADVIVQGNYVHGVIEARSPLHTQVISNQTQLDQQTRLALRQEMINNIDPNMVIERYYDWEITVDPSLSALEQQ